MLYMSTLEQSDSEAAAVQQPGHPRVTLESLLAQIVQEEYSRPSFAQHVTKVTLLCKNGFVLHGASAPADPANYNEEFGRKLAKDDAIRQLWPILGYQLREQLHQAEQAAK